MYHKTVIKDSGLCEFFGAVDRLNGALFEFYRLTAFFNGEVNELFSDGNAPIMINTNVCDHECRPLRANNAVSYFTLAIYVIKPRVMPFSYFQQDAISRYD